MFPVEDAHHKTRVLAALHAMFRDTVKSRWLEADGSYRRRPPSARGKAFRVQDELQRQARRASKPAEATGVTFQPEHGDGPR
jgi:polyphosphate kinase